MWTEVFDLEFKMAGMLCSTESYSGSQRLLCGVSFCEYGGGFGVELQCFSVLLSWSQL